MKDLSDLLKEYREAAIGMDDIEHTKVQHRWHDKWHACYKILRETEEGRNGIISLMADENPSVRGCAAAHSLQWVPAAARKVLEEIRDSGGGPWFRSFDAKMTLSEFDKGRLKFNY